MKYYKKIGEHGEGFATQVLEDKGYDIIIRNYRCKAGEVDIVARKGNCFHFVEVKTRTSDDYGKPCEAVNLEKQRRIKRAAEFFMVSHGFRDYMVQFDVIEISVNMLWGCF